MVRFVSHELINKNKWDEALDTAVNSYIYAYSYFLDTVCDGQWDALISDDYQLIMPLPYRKKMGLKYVYPPVFNQQLGVFYQRQCSNFQLIEFFRAMPRSIRYLEMNFNKYLFGRLPENMVAKTKTNYELEVFDNYDNIYASYSENLRRNIKKAIKNKLKEINYVQPSELISLFKNNKGKDLRAYTEEDYKRLEKLIYLLMHRGKAEVRGVINPFNQVIAAALFVKSKGRIIFLFSGLNDEGRDSGAMPFLIDHYIRTRQDRRFIFDFEGSNNPSLARFYASFGAKAFSYEQVLVNKLFFPLRQLKRIKDSKR
jgi:hypothetical protein